MFGHDICLKGRLYTFLIFSEFKIHNSISLWVKITRKPNSIGHPSLCFARKQSSNSATGCDVINRWLIGTRNFAKSWAPPLAQYHKWYFKIVTRNLRQFWNIASGIYAKYHVQIMLLFVYTATHERFVIFTCRYFNLSRKYHCSKPIKLQKFLISHACNSRKGNRARRSLVRDRGKQQEQSLKMC